MQGNQKESKQKTTTATTTAAMADNDTDKDAMEGTVDTSKEADVATPDLNLESVTDGQNEQGIPIVRFIEDIDGFATSFQPPASAELLIGAYSDLFSKFKRYETTLVQKRELLQ